MNITLRGSFAPAEQIRDQIRGLVTSGLLGANESLPSVRQLARDLGIAPGTVAKSYRELEAEGILVTRIGSGTRVSPTAATTPGPVLEAARRLASTSVTAGVGLDEATRVLRATWPQAPGGDMTP